MDKLIISVAMNEYTTREQNPHVPITPEEIANDAYACYNAGASIVHFHPRDPETTVTRATDVVMYEDIASRIRDQCDLIWYPTYDGLRTDDGLGHVYELNRSGKGRLESHLIAVGAFNPTAYDFSSGQWVNDNAGGFRHATIEPFFRYAVDTGLKPILIVYELGNIKSTLLFRKLGLLRDPVAYSLRFSEDQTFGPEPNAEGVKAYVSVIPKDVPHLWFVQVYGGPHHLMNQLAVSMGGHARTGTGELAQGPDGPEPNARMVERIAAMAKAIGRDVATTAEARAMLGMV